MTLAERIDITENSWLDILKLSKRLRRKDNFDELWNLHPEEKHQIRIHGKLIPVPRFQQSYLRDYTFSGTVSKSLDLPEEFQPYLRWANKQGYGKFNQVLINWYETGANYISKHADSERQLVPDSPIMTITLTGEGLPRTFRVRRKDTSKIIQDFETHHGMVIVMGGKCQKECTHEIVKTTGSKSEKMAPRISITLRIFE